MLLNFFPKFFLVFTFKIEIMVLVHFLLSEGVMRINDAIYISDKENYSFGVIVKDRVEVD